MKKQAAKIEDRVIKAGPTGAIALPVVIYFHGGGWVLGDRNTHDCLVREIANGAQAAVVFVDYDRSPETQ